MDLVNAACRFVSQAVLPPLCIVCGDGGDGFVPGIDICGACVADLPLNGPACSLCAMPLPSTSLVSPICGQCLKKRPKYQASFCAYRYGYPIDHLLRAFKFHGRLAYGRVLGELLSIALSSARRETWPKILVPVPLARNDRAEALGSAWPG